jgi:hypothetical protein
MKLYQLAFFLFALLTACAAPRISQGTIAVSVTADGETQTVQVPAGSTVGEALTAGGIAPGNLDRTEPPLYTVLENGSRVRLMRVREEFSVGQVVLPYESRIVKNESLPDGQEYWLQMGETGLQEITTRRVFEDDVEVSSNAVNVVTLREPQPQIKMVGVQKPFAPIPIPGRLVYILDGNAWLMEETTANRRQIVNTGDLDGRVFSLSADGKWLLFTRRGMDENTINTLWAKPLDDAGGLTNLKVSNVVHFADWKPGSTLTVVFSTVEPRPSAPGWQANNDLAQRSFGVSGFLNPVHTYLETNAGGVYGWWGTAFAFAPEGLRLAYSRPDGFGVLNLQSGEQTPMVEITPLQTFGDWAWSSAVAWGWDGETLYGTVHLPPADSPQFDLVAVPVQGGAPLTLVRDVGMFAYPAVSPFVQRSSGERAYQVAYLQALFPAQGERSRYRLMVMDRDGSNRRALYPLEGSGLEPQHLVWSPQPLAERRGYAIAVLDENNLWLVDTLSGEFWQVTGDGLTSRVDWK